MMTFNEMDRRGFPEPFSPIRIQTTNGRTFEVRNVHDVLIGRSKLTLSALDIEIPDAKGPWYHLPFSSIQLIEPLEAPASKGDNAMMTPRVIMEHVFAEPFRPLRIHTASGRTFEVRHPEFVKMGRSTLTIYAPPQGDPDGPLRWEEISLMLIESIAPLDAAAANPGAQ